MQRITLMLAALFRFGQVSGRAKDQVSVDANGESNVTRIRLMTDYLCRPCWWMPDPAHPERIGDFDPGTLPLSAGTRAELERWQEWYDGHLDLIAPHQMDDGWSPAEEDAFEEAGIALWHRVRHELGAGYDVCFFSQKRGKLLEHPRELLK